MDENKKSDAQAICTPFAPSDVTARTYEGKLYYGTIDVAKIIGVTRQTVSNWHNSLFHDAPIFKADLKTHDGRLLYEVERVEQLKAIYRANWTLGSYEPAPVDEDDHTTAAQGADDGTADETPPVDDVTVDETPSLADGLTLAVTHQHRVDMAAKFFDMLFGGVKERKYGYLWVKEGKSKGTYSFDVSTQDGRRAMAQKAIELNDEGVAVYYSINLVDKTLPRHLRATRKTVTVQTATVTDIDVEGGNHQSNSEKKYPPSFDTAKAFLPFPVSLVIKTGYGLHGLCIYKEPIAITDENRDSAESRNKKFINVIRHLAGEYATAVDGVGDLPRVFRVPGTFNYKSGVSADAPLCEIVEATDIRFTPADLDEKLNTFAVETTQAAGRDENRKAFSDLKPARTPVVQYNVDDDDARLFLVEGMLSYIYGGDYGIWVPVGMALFNEGFGCDLWRQWSRNQPKFNEDEDECGKKWNSFNYDPNGYKIGTLYYLAVQNGYDAKARKREYYQLHPEKSHRQRFDAAQIEILKNAHRFAEQKIADFDKEKDAAIETLRSVEVFDSATVFSQEVKEAAAFAKAFDKEAFSDFKREVQNYGVKNKDKKVAIKDWLADVKPLADEITQRRGELISRCSKIQADIDSADFVSHHDILKDFPPPTGYSFTAAGVVKGYGEKQIRVCRQVVVITEKSYSVDESKYKVTLSILTSKGKWKALPPIEKAVVCNKNKIVDLANNGLPVTTSNAKQLVDYLDDFDAQNGNTLPMTLHVPRCGWYKFGGKDFFIDPRRDCVIQDEGKNISVKVDETRSYFARHLKGVGDIEKWKHAYELAKNSPVARLIVAASVAPILLEILGERNFLLYICAPTRAGKTTALYLGASAVGSEKIIRSFDATKNGLAGAAADVNDYAFFVDEKQVADKRLKDSASLIVYALANGIGRTKLNRDSTLKETQYWQTIAIMTGETALLPDDVTGGANTRLLSIDAPKEILPGDVCNEIRNTIKKNHGLVFPLVIDKVFELGGKTLRSVYEYITKSFAEEHTEYLPEYHRYMAALTVADIILNTALFGGTVTHEEGNPVDDAQMCFKEIFKLLKTRLEIDDTQKEKDFVLSFINEKQNCFIGERSILERMQAVYGKLHDPDGYTYITAKALKDACAREGRDYQKLVNDLIAIGFFVPAGKTEEGDAVLIASGLLAPADKTEDKHKKPPATVQKRLGYANARCYRIPNSFFEGLPAEITPPASM